MSAKRTTTFLSLSRTNYDRTIIGSILVFLLLIAVHSYCYGQSAKSNELFARGVELYQAGKYSEAIPLFEEVVLIDSTDATISSSRRVYGSHWLSSCYYKLGKLTEAEKARGESFDIPPIDRRLTVVSDSLSDELSALFIAGHYEEAALLAQRIADLERSELGGETAWSMNTTSGLAVLLALTGKSEEAHRTIDETIANCTTLYGSTARLMETLLGTYINVYMQEGDIDGVNRGFERLIEYYTAAGRGDSDDCYQHLDNWANICLQTGRMDRYDHVQRLREERQRRVYGSESEEMAFLMISAAKDNAAMKRTDIAMLQALAAEEAGFKAKGKSSSARLVAIMAQASIYMQQNDLKNAKQKARAYLRDMKYASEDMLNLAPMVTSMLTMIQTMTGKTDKDLTNETLEAVREMANNPNVSKDNYVTTCSIIALSLAMAGDTEVATSLIAPLQDYLVERRDFSKLINSGLVFLQAEQYVNARKAYGHGLRLLNEEMSYQYAAKTVSENRKNIDIALEYIANKTQGVFMIGQNQDTISYTLSAIKQNLLEAKMLIMEHSDSLGTPEFMRALTDYAHTAIVRTGDEMTADSIVNIYATKLKEHYGEASPQYDEASQLCGRLIAERNAKPHYYDEEEQWPTVPSMREILRNHDFERDFARCDTIYRFYLDVVKHKDRHKGLSSSPEHALWRALDGWSLCADSLGLNNEVGPRLTEMWQALIDSDYDAKHLILNTMATAWMHCGKEEFITFSTEVGTQLNDPPGLMLCCTMLQVMYILSDFYSHISKSTYARVSGQIDSWLQVVCGQNGETDPTYRHLFMLRTMALWTKRWDYDVNNERLRSDFTRILEWLEQDTELRAVRQSYEAMNMLCDLANGYPSDYQLVVRADKMRNLVKKKCLEEMEKQRVEYESRGLRVRPSWPSLSPLGEDFKLYTRNDTYYLSDEELDTHISLAYSMVKEKRLTSAQDAYERLLASWNEIRDTQRDAFIDDDKLLRKIEKLNNEAHAAVQLNSDSLACLAYDIVLFSKGYLLRSEQLLGKVLEESGNKTVLRRFREYQSIRQQLDNTTLTTHEADSLRSEARSLWWNLKGTSQAFDDYTKQLEASWKDVRDALDDDEVAIEYLTPSNDYGSYYALVLRKGYEAPRVVSTTSEWRINNDGDSIYYDRYSGVWPFFISNDGNFEHLLEGVRHIYVSPSGALHRVGMESLHDLYTDSLMSEKYHIYRLSNTRNIIDLKARKKEVAKEKHAVLYGGIEYDIDDSTWKKMAQSQNHDDGHAATRDAALFSRGAAELTIQPLDGTKREVEQIGQVMEEEQIDCHTYVGTEATEGELKRMSGSEVTMLHIATHGFYQDNGKVKEEMDESLAKDGDSVEENALSRSGLFLAGAAALLNGTAIPDNLDDGILTAREISHLDFTNVNLVTLSACETALGDITGDGVFGLQRGFKKAGAQSILMSLWKVDDEATCLLMTEFYRNWITGGMTKHEALELAKQAVRSHKEKGWDDPKYWAAFILLDALD